MPSAAEPVTPRTPRTPHGRPRHRRILRVAAVAASICIAASALVVFWQSTAGLRGGTGSQHPVLDELDQQFSHSFWDIGTQIKAEVAAMFEQITLDFEPYTNSNITLEMVEQAYCSCRRSGFRFQSIDNKLYVAGEIRPWQSRQEYIKKQLLDLLRVDGSLPDVDIYFGSTDFPEDCDLEEMPAHCKRKGPHFQHTKTKADDWIILHPDETFGGWPESKIGPWPETQQVMTMSANHFPWSERRPRLFFAGANLGFQRRNVSMVEWKNYPEMDVRWVNWGKPETLVPLHDFCQFRYLLHLAGCSWSSRLKYLMLCRAAIVFPDSAYLEFWYRALTPGKNYIALPEMVSPESGVSLLRVAERLISNEPLAKRLAAGAQATALHTLSIDNIREYWRRLLRTYAALQTFRPAVHPDAIPLHVSITHPRFVAPEARTCKICAHPSWKRYKHSFCRGVDD